MVRHTREELLKYLTNPDVVAVIGASSDESRLTSRPQRYLHRHGFKGTIFPVNARHAEVQGAKAYPTINAVPKTVDTAYILLNTESAIEQVEECGKAGVKTVAVVADGFADAGSEGLVRQKQLREIADEYGLFLIGPNSTGLIKVQTGFVCTTNAAFATEHLLPGRTAVLSQSGSLIGTMMSRGAAVGIGFSSLVSVGNEAQQNVATLGEVLLQDPDTDSFVLFLETLRNPEALSRFAYEARRADKPVFAYVVGQSPEGQALSVSHTGALTGTFEALDGFLHSNGIKRIDVFESLIEAPSASRIVNDRLGARHRAVTVVSTTGGGGAMVVDQLSRSGVPIARCSTTAKQRLADEGVRTGEGKLIDLTLAGANYDTMKRAISILAEDSETGVLLVVIGSSAQFQAKQTVQPIIDAVQELGDRASPVIAFPLPDALEGLCLLNRQGIPSFRTVESCATSVSTIFSSVTPNSIASKPANDSFIPLPSGLQPGLQNEIVGKEVLEACGIPTPRRYFLGVTDPVPETLTIDFPVVAKIVSKGIPHKTEIGVVQLNISSIDQLKNAIAAMHTSIEQNAPDAAIDGVLIEEMSQAVGEVLIGLTRDPLVGPVITLAMGGILAELYRDSCVRPAPVDKTMAMEMIKSIKGLAPLRGYRNLPKGDIDALAEAVSAFSRLALNDRVVEAEINPVHIRPEGDGVVALDAVLRLA